MRRFFLSSLIPFIGILLLGCSEETDIETETSINYTLTLSPDLLKFVIPQVQYIDENGVLVTITGVEELDGLVIENGAEAGGAKVWSKQIISGTGYKCWTINMKFNHLNFHSYMGVKYIRNDLVDNIDENVYDFHHSINTSITSATQKILRQTSLFTTTDYPGGLKVYADTHMSITLNGYYTGENLKLYLDSLTVNPDKAGYYINDEGGVSRNDDFEMK